MKLLLNSSAFIIKPMEGTHYLNPKIIYVSMFALVFELRLENGGDDEKKNG